MARRQSRGPIRFYKGPTGGDLILLLASAMLGVIVATWLSSKESPAVPSWLMLVVLAVIVALIALIVSKVNALSRTLASFDLTGISNVRTLTESQISQTASEFIATARAVRVIGTARQDVLESDDTAKGYLRATERRLRDVEKLYYRRITIKALRPEFLSHLERILSKDWGNQIHDVQVAAVDALDYAVSYQIFDDVAALIIVDVPTVPGVYDNVRGFLIRDASMVDALISHFDHAWAQRSPIRTTVALRQVISTQETKPHR